MEKLKAFFQSFCVITTGALLGMIISLELIDHQIRVRVIDLCGLMIISFLAIVLKCTVRVLGERIRNFDKVGSVVHYIGTMGILILIGKKLEWIGLDQNRHIVTFFIIITFIYAMVLLVRKIIDYRTSQNINDALQHYRQAHERH